MTEVVDALLGVPYPTVWRTPYNVTSVNVTTAPSVEPVDLATAKLHLRVTDTAQDTLIQTYIVAARSYVEQVCQRALINQTWTATFDDFKQPLLIPGGNVQAVTSLQYTDVNGAVQTILQSVAAQPSLTNSAGLSPPVQSALTQAAGGTFATGTYYYVVSAINGSGETLKSNEQFIVVSQPNQAVTVSWGAVGGATGYKVYRGTSAGAERVQFTIGAVTSFVDTGASFVADFSSFPARLYPPMSQGWPTVGDVPAAVKCVYTLGYGSAPTNIPAPLTCAILLLVGDFYENREAHVPTRYFVANDTVDMLLFPYKRIEP